MKKLYSFAIIILLWAVYAMSLSAADKDVQVWKISEDNWQTTTALLRGMAGEGQTLIAGDQVLEAPAGAWVKFDEPQGLVAVYDSPERIKALQDILLLEPAIHHNGELRYYDVKEGMSIKTRDYVKHKVRREFGDDYKSVKSQLFQADLIVAAPAEKISDIAKWVEEIQPEEKVVVKADQSVQSAPIRQTIFKRRRTPSPYRTGRYGLSSYDPDGRSYYSDDPQFLAGYNESRTEYFRGMGRYGVSRSRGGVSLYGSDSEIIIDSHSSRSDFIIDRTGPLFDFSYSNGDFDFNFGTGRNFSFDNGVTRIW